MFWNLRLVGHDCRGFVYCPTVEYFQDNLDKIIHSARLMFRIFTPITSRSDDWS